MLGMPYSVVTALQACSTEMVKSRDGVFKKNKITMEVGAEAVRVISRLVNFRLLSFRWSPGGHSAVYLPS